MPASFRGDAKHRTRNDGAEDRRNCMDLIASHITHRFGDLAVLDDVSFSVGAGEVVAIVGPSGCGKSSLLSFLGGLLLLCEGKAELRGEPPDDSLNPLTI